MSGEKKKFFNDKWRQYYKATSGRKPRRLLLEAVKYLDKESGFVLDVGAGDLTDSIYLLKRGFSVIALDSSPTSEDLSKNIDSKDFTFVKSEYDKFNFPPDQFDLISAQLALPFNKPETFREVLEKIKISLKPGGVFTGHFFGINDDWNNPNSGMSFHSRKNVEQLLSGMKIIKFEEEESDKATAGGTIKHWHIFEVIASYDIPTPYLEHV